MSNVIYNSRIPLSHLGSLIKSCHFPAEALVLMECLPQNIITNRQERQNLLLFTFFNPDLAFEKYTSGRIFQKSGELRWEKEHEQVRLVYVGDKGEFSTQVEGLLSDSRPSQPNFDTYAQQKKYYLFGTRLEENDLEMIGPAAKAGDFAEGRIHRLLRYPVKEDTKGPMCFIIQELYDKATSQLVLFRFVGLDEQGEEATKR